MSETTEPRVETLAVKEDSTTSGAESVLFGVSIRAWVCAALVATMCANSLLSVIYAMTHGTVPEIDETLRGAVYVALGYYFGQKGK